MTSRVVSRSGRPTTSGGRNNPSLACNKCFKSLSTTVFVCSCDCVFCEECTYEHFNTSSECPICKKTLGANDFLELCIADPSTASSEPAKHTLQTLLTKYSPTSKGVTYHEMCSRVMKTLDNDRRAVRFLLKQCVNDAANQTQKSGGVAHAYEKLKREYTQLKQTASSQKIQHDQTVEELQHRIHALTGSVDELQKSLKEKDVLISQFRDIYSNATQNRNVASSPSLSSTGSQRNPYASRSRAHSNSSRHPAPPPPPPPPMHEFLLQKEAREREKEYGHNQIARSRARNPLGTSNTTPLYGFQRPLSMGSNQSSTMRSPSGNNRPFTSNDGYTFTNHPPGHANKRRAIDVSPANAFAFSKRGTPSHFHFT